MNSVAKHVDFRGSLGVSETTDAPAWVAITRRVQAEESAREAAVTDLTAYVEK
jgi:hypothetical protein